MSSSYTKNDIRVKQSTQSQKKTAPARTTVTFEPYYWEAYNEIVQPQRIRWYLDTKWIRDLGLLGHAIVSNLRSRLYFNPASGEVRNSIELTMEDLCDCLGVSRTTLFREFKNNAALAQFVRKTPTYHHVDDTRVQKTGSTYWVAMDDPIHPSDLERYEELRARKEQSRNDQQPPAKSLIKDRRPHTLQNETNGETAPAHTFQNETNGFQIETPVFQNETYDNKVSLLPFNTVTTVALPDAINNGEPGEGETDTWERALTLMEPKVSTPTLQTHLRPLRIVREDAGAVELCAPSVFTREWLQKRHGPLIESALSQVLGHDVEVRIVAAA